MNNEFNRELWVKAQENAKREYEEEHGSGSWDDADKYEREDEVWYQYEKLLSTKGNKMMQMRDSKGRFIKANNETTNTNSIKKENNNMRTNNAEMRTMKLAQAGVDTSKFFNLSMNIPFGAEVKILVNNEEMVIPAQNPTVEGFVLGGRKVEMCNGDLVDSLTGEVVMMGAHHDSIAQNIINDGYVKNSKLFRRWITAHTFKMLNYTAWRNPNRTGWEACMKDCYSYAYQFEQMADELHTLAKLQREDPEYFEERTKFFNGDVAVALLEDYLYRLKKYVKKQMRENPKAYRGQAYVKLAKYGNVLVKDLDVKVYAPIQNGINDLKCVVKSGSGYTLIERTFRDFMSKLYNKLPYETPKCAVWKDAFKGAGAYYTLQNLIRFHGINTLGGCRGKYECEEHLVNLLNGEYRNEVWRFHQLLVDTIKYNNFDLKKSIAEGNCAPNTTSSVARRYK